MIDDIPSAIGPRRPSSAAATLVLAIGTGGMSPTIEARSERLQHEFGAGWAEFLRVVGEVRWETLPALPDFAERAQRWHDAFDLDEAAELAREGRSEELRTRLRSRLLGEVKAS